MLLVESSVSIMVFGATHVCPSCRLRMARRDACPKCGGAVVSLTGPEGRRAAAGGAEAGPVPIASLVIGAVTTAVAAASVARDMTALAATAGAVGLALAVFVAFRDRRRPRGEQPLRVYVPDAEVEGTTPDEVVGIARRATVVIESPLGGEPCLAFGVRGATRGGEIDDADGGDFDVVVPGGAVVMVSLEHAVLLPMDGDVPRALGPGEELRLGGFLRDRGLTAAAPLSIAESRLAEGDTVRVVGRVHGAAVVAEGSKPRSRVLAGEPDAPLLVAVVARARA